MLVNRGIKGRRGRSKGGDQKGIGSLNGMEHASQEFRENGGGLDELGGKRSAPVKTLPAAKKLGNPRNEVRIEKRGDGRAALSITSTKKGRWAGVGWGT